MDPVVYRDGIISLSPSEQKFWLEKFGDVRLLDLALIAAAADVAPNPKGPTPYVARVRSFLARMAYYSLERKGWRAPQRTVSRGPRDTSEPFHDYVKRINGHTN